MKCNSCPYNGEVCKMVRDELINLRIRTHKWTKIGAYVADGSSLCWCCQKAWDQSCSWMREKKPVNFWYAKETICDGKRSYNVKTCPEFERRIPQWIKDKMA